MKIALAQINTTVGDFAGNQQRILQAWSRARELGADLVVFPELTLTGYPPRDLLDRPDFIRANLQALEEIKGQITAPACVLGFVSSSGFSGFGKKTYNAAAFIQQKRITLLQAKRLLPTYDVFDEARYFIPAKESLVLKFQDKKIAISICEDFWNDAAYEGGRPYSADPVEDLARMKPDYVLNISASPFSYRKPSARLALLQRQVRRIQSPLVYVNLVGGNDDVIFDGGSVVLNGQGEVCAQLASFQEDLQVVDLSELRPLKLKTCCEKAQVLDALILGFKDYLKKCGMSRVVLGLSGGIDSALCAWIAAQALGADKVLGVAMPSPFSSAGSLSDAEDLAKALGIELRVMPITELFKVYRQSLNLEGEQIIDISLQNIQARIRGNLLMALSNREGRLLLSTSNKSELAMGYGTLYGDMAGGISPLADVSKTLVYQLARIANVRQAAIPQSSLDKPPSAELAPGQMDQDDLPPYETLDAILAAYVEEAKMPEEIVAMGHAPELVESILRRLDRFEYKRQQAALGLKVTAKAFGSGRRVPIAQAYNFK